MHTSAQFHIKQLRAKSLLMMVESLSVFVAALFTSALLPSLLFRYMYANAQLVEQPKILEYIPVVAFVVGIGYFLVAAVGNIMREIKIMKLTKELNEMGCDCDCGCCQTDMVNHTTATERKVGRPRKIASK